MPSKHAGRSGATYRKHRNQMKAERQPCYICREPINYEAKAGQPDAFELEHILPLSTHPHLAEDPANLGAAHMSCNRSKGTGDAIYSVGNLPPEF